MQNPQTQEKLTCGLDIAYTAKIEVLEDASAEECQLVDNAGSLICSGYLAGSWTATKIRIYPAVG